MSFQHLQSKYLLTTLFSVIALACPPTLAAKDKTPQTANKSDVAEKQSDLKELREKIEALRKDISTAEGTKSEVADQLKQSEREISHLQRELHELGEEKQGLQSTLRQLGQQSKTIEGQLAEQQAQLALLLHHQYLRGSPDALQLLLNGEDPNQIARDLHYLGSIAQSRRDLLTQLEANLKKKQILLATTHERTTALAVVEEKQKDKHGKLLTQREQKKSTLSKISAQVAAQKKEVGALQRDQKRMTQLISRLSKLIASREAAREKASKRPEPSKRPSSAGVAAIENDRLPEAAPSGNFSSQKGRLRLPVKGTVSNRYGSPRQEGTTWKGLFIRSPVGSDVKAVANGRIVFAEWMRGFGNLMIIDHGDSYLSIYGNNDALLKQVGDSIRGGDTIASVGNSGGNPESGLYFEIRHQGNPVDPLKWASLK